MLQTRYWVKITNFGTVDLLSLRASDNKPSGCCWVDVTDCLDVCCPPSPSGDFLVDADNSPLIDGNGDNLING